MYENEPLQNKIYKLLYNNIVTFSAITLSAFCFGMLVMALLIGLYYTCLFPTLPTASLEAPAMYDYANDYQDLRIKKDVTNQDEDENLSDYLQNPPKRANDLYRSKRNETTPLPPEAVTSVDKTLPTESQSTSPGVGVSTAANEQHQTNTTTTATPPEEVDFSISARFIDSVFNYAASNSMKDPLGLCRNNINIKIPQFNISLFPPQDSDEILTCLNDVLKNMTSGNLCIQLEDELKAYLRWLVLTGEPRAKPPKQPTNDDVLFPSSCGDDSHLAPKHVTPYPMNNTNSTC